MNIEQERAAFEAWFTKTFISGPKDIFTQVVKDIAWEAWQARAALQSQDAEDAERYRWLRDPCSGAEHVIFYSRGDYGKGLMSGEMLDEAIDHARRIEGEA